MRLVLRATAVGDLDSIFDYGVVTHGADTPGAYVRNIEAVMDRLVVHPALGAARDLRASLRSIATGEHRIYYRIEVEAIIIARVLHRAMDAERWV